MPLSIGGHFFKEGRYVPFTVEQQLEHTIERGGRRQDKEKAMERLRKLGYM
jgi:hypothetical protein